ncbi:MAG: DNA-3-methyladenine glycosylase I [Tatlockia sp.]|nr:DNA-3-methyladenine glycosylase I [Tatlockia sp.]
MERCAWCLKDPLYIAYHDEEWGLPVKNREKLFEMIILESMQAGLSWFTILKKREAMRAAFFQFSPERLANLSDPDFNSLLNNENIIRNRLKIKSLQTNAKSFLKVEARENIIDYLWQFTEGKVVQNKRQALTEIPALTPASTAMAKQLKKDGFVFVGPTTCYAFMQSVGMVNDHLQSCFRHKQCF